MILEKLKNTKKDKYGNVLVAIGFPEFLPRNSRQSFDVTACDYVHRSEGKATLLQPVFVLGMCVLILIALPAYILIWFQCSFACLDMKHDTGLVF